MKENYNKELKSAGFRIKSGMTGSEEQGRSMVEMLGVLAVMGVLSVGGVAMYTSAMNKHRANEILNEASKRAVLVAAQAMTGKTGEISLAEFGNNSVSGVTFAGTANVADNKITLGLSGTGLADICAQLKNATGDNTVMQVNTDCSEFTFNADMSTGSDSSDNTDSDPACAGVECPEGTTCGVAGNCVAPAASNGCSKNSDCNTWCETNGYDKCYCAISSTPNWNDSNCYTIFTGTCVEVVTNSDITGGYVASSGSMTWWSAVNFCKAAKTGGKLVSLSDLGITGGYEDGAWCGSSSCTGANWSDLYSELGDSDYWVTDAVSCTDPENDENCTSGSNNNSCRAFAVCTGVSIVDTHPRNDGRSALCE